MFPQSLYTLTYAKDRIREDQLEAARQRALPSFRQRLANKLQALAEWLEPGGDVYEPKPRVQRAH